MGENMKALQIVEPGRAEWQTTPVPHPGAGEVLVKVLGVTTCPHWDLHMMDGEPMFPGGSIHYPLPPGQPGHEAMGEVVELGQDVAGPGVGARVVAWRDPGHDRQGSYAQYVPFAVENLLEIPGELEAETIAPLELAMCVQVSFDQLGKLDAVQGKRFGVSGLGPSGLIAVQMARAFGAREIVAIDPMPERRRLAATLGADVVLSPDQGRLTPERFGPDALDAAIDCTGLKVSIEFLMERTKNIVSIFGVLRENVVFGPNQWHGAFTLMGYGSHNRGAAERALQLVLDGSLRLAPLVTHTLPLSRYTEGVELLRSRQAIKAAFLPWG